MDQVAQEAPQTKFVVVAEGKAQVCFNPRLTTANGGHIVADIDDDQDGVDPTGPAWKIAEVEGIYPHG